MSDQPPPPPPASQPPPPEGDPTATIPAIEDGPKPWYKKWWGILLIVLGVFIIIGALTGNDDEDTDPAADDDEDVEESEAADTLEMPDVVGDDLESARETLEDLDLEVEEDDVDEDRAVINPANWQVETQEPEPGAELESGDTVTLGVFRPDDREEQAAEEEADDEPEPESDPEEPEEPEEEPEPETEPFDPVTLDGAGDDVIDIPTSPDHLLVATISHDGSSNFAIESHSADGDGDLLVNTIGSYAGTVPVNFSFDPDEFEITADGSWEIVITDLFEQPILEDSIEGTGDEVLVVDTDASRLAITHDGESNFAILGWGQQGDLLVNEIGAYDGTVRMGDALALQITADGDWTIDAE